MKEWSNKLQNMEYYATVTQNEKNFYKCIWTSFQDVLSRKEQSGGGGRIYSKQILCKEGRKMLSVSTGIIKQELMRLTTGKGWLKCSRRKEWDENGVERSWWYEWVEVRDGQTLPWVHLLEDVLQQNTCVVHTNHHHHYDQ